MKLNFIIILLLTICGLLVHIIAKINNNNANTSTNMIPHETDAAEASSFTITKFSDIKPTYPEESMAEGEEGTVEIGFFIEPNGIISEAFVIQSSGFQRLDNAAVETIKKYRYRDYNEPSRKFYRTKINYLL